MANREKALKLLRERVVGHNVAHSPNVYVVKRKTKAPVVETWGRKIELPNDFNAGEGVYVAFIDHMPGANFEHHVQYAFVNEADEVIHIVDAMTPPDDLEDNYNRVEL